MGRSVLGYALIPLAVVVGTNVEDGMVLTVIPAHEHVILLDKGEEAAAVGCHLAPLAHLRQEPRPRYDGMRLEQFEARRGTHLAADYTLEVFLHRQFVDGAYMVGFHHEAQCAEERLRLLAFPVEVDTDSHVVQREGGICRLRMEGQFAVLVAVPEHTAFTELHHLFACHRLALGLIGLVQGEAYLLPAHYAYSDIGLFSAGIKGREGGRCIRLTCHLQFGCNALYLLHTHATFAQYGSSRISRQPAEIVLTRGDDKTAHVECTG